MVRNKPVRISDGGGLQLANYPVYIFSLLPATLLQSFLSSVSLFDSLPDAPYLPALWTFSLVHHKSLSYPHFARPQLHTQGRFGPTNSWRWLLEIGFLFVPFFFS